MTGYPKLAVSVGIWRKGEVLLIRRGHEPLKDYWTFPGGHVEFGEKVSAAVHREVAEEVGLRIEIAGEPLLHEIILRDAAGEATGHHVLLVHAARVVGDDKPLAGSDAAEARWLNPELLGGMLLTQGLKGFIARTAKMLAAAVAP